MVGFPSATTHVHQRPYHRTHLFPQKPGSFHVDTNLVTVTFDVTSQNFANHRRSYGSGRCHRGIIHLADEVRRPRFHGFDVKRVPIVIHVSMDQLPGGSMGRVENSVAVEFARCASGRVELRLNVAQGDDAQVLGKARPDRMGEFSRVQRAGCMKVTNVTSRVNSRIGPPAADQRNGMAHRPSDGCFERFLNCA